MNVIVHMVIQLLIASTESLHVLQKCWSTNETIIGHYMNLSYQLVFVNQNRPVELQCRQWYTKKSKYLLYKTDIVNNDLLK